MITMKAISEVDKAIMNLGQVQIQMRKALREEGEAIRAEYNKTTTTWHHKINFTIADVMQGENFGVSVSTSDEPYWFVHESVSVLRAVFTNDWVPKTQPGVLGSSAGSGSMLYASKKINKKPYRARKFTEKIIEVRQKPFQDNMQKAMAQAVADAQGKP